MIYRLGLLTVLPLLTATAQSTVTLSAPVLNVRPGQTAALNVAFSTSNAAAMQWTAVMPAGWTATAIPGSRAVAAGKQVACNPSNGVCLVYGMNATAMQAGEVAVYTVTVPATAAAGNYPIQIASPVAVGVTGAVIPTTAGPLVTLRVLSRNDLNSDGAVDVADVSLAVDQARGITACGSADINGSGGCDIVDVFVLVLAVLAGG